MEITGLKYLPRCNFIVLFFPYFKNITVVPLKTGRERRVVDQKKDVWVYSWFFACSRISECFPEWFRRLFLLGNFPKKKKNKKNWVFGGMCEEWFHSEKVCV